jgi:hypothetical protein
VALGRESRVCGSPHDPKRVKREGGGPISLSCVSSYGKDVPEHEP